MRIIMPSLLLAPWLMLMPVMGQNLKLPISNYTSKVYGRNYEAANYCIVTDLRNMVYAGNGDGIMEYDGSEWRFIPVSHGAYVTSMACSQTGIIFVGSQQEFGFLEPDQTGTLQYRSLSGQLPDEDQFFSVVWSTHCADGFTVFQAEECLYIYKDDSLRAIYPETSFHTSLLVGSDLYVRERGVGLKILQDEAFVPVRGGSVFAELGIFGMFPGNNGSILIATTEKGFFLYDPLRGIEHMPTGNDEFLIRAGIFGGIELRDGNIALHTRHEGVIICNREGRIKAVINKHSGLQVDDVKDVYQDAYNNIWCALDNGISKIDYSSPASFYGENAGLEGSAHAIVRHEGRLFVGTTSGLFVEDKIQVLNKSLEFITWPGIRDQVWSLTSIGSSLMVGTNNGLYRIQNGSTQKISGINAFAMLYLDKEKLLLVGGAGEFAAFSPLRNWKKIKDFSDIRVDIKSIARNKTSSYNAMEIWLGTSLQGTLKILINPDLSHEAYHYYGMPDGLPDDWILPFAYKDSIIFGTRHGILHFIDENQVREFLPDSLKDLPEYNRGYFEGANLFNQNIILPLRSVVNSYGRIWALIDNEITMAHQDSPDDVIEKPFRAIDLGEINQIYPDDENTVWFAAGDGLARFDLANMEKSPAHLHSAIRTVTITGDSLVFNGSYFLPGIKDTDDPGDFFKQPEKTIPVFSHAYNDLTFYFSSPFYDNEGENQFSWKLEGDNSNWSNWSDRRISTYTNIFEGEYTFMLKSKNIYGNISEPTGYSFIIRPPWFRTTYAYISYIILLILFVYSAVRMGQLRLRKKNERLEAIVQERTAEIRKQNIKLAAQKKEITDSIYYAERIQRAILPHTDQIANQIEGYFILFQPKDIVSGDFYWLAENGKKIIITAVDCTGHGVPGAFMSMLGISFLNKIILENNILHADRILNDLRDNVVSSLKQTGREGEARDGMDMALAVIDLEKMTMEFAGANNPLYMIRENELTETKADRMPIAYHIETGKFSNHLIELNKGDTFYLFSDGYADQFGGPRGKKFMYKPFKNLLIENRKKPMAEINKILEDRIEAWKAPNGPDGEIFEQVDDILVIGIRI